jgi:hypothetical protein
VSNESILWTISVGLMGSVVVLQIVAAQMRPTTRALRHLRGQVPRRLSDVASGTRARLDGIVRQRGAGLTSPFTGKRCVGYVYEADERGSEGWTEAHRQSECAPFDVLVDGEVARVEGPFVLGLPLATDDGSTDVSEAMRAALHRALVDTTLPWGGPRMFRYREAWLEDDQEISVLGEVTLERAQPGSELRVIRGTHQNPVFVAYRLQSP